MHECRGAQDVHERPCHDGRGAEQKAWPFPSELGIGSRRIRGGVHLPHRDVQMPWAQDALEQPCTRVALDEIRFMLRGRAQRDGPLS